MFVGLRSPLDTSQAFLFLQRFTLLNFTLLLDHDGEAVSIWSFSFDQSIVGHFNYFLIPALLLISRPVI